MQAHQLDEMRAAVRLAHDIDLEFLRERKDAGPLFVFMYRARGDAIDALVALASVDPANTEQVRKLQNEWQRYVDSLAYVKDVLNAGYEAAKILKSEEADELRAVVGDDEAVAGE